MNSEAQMTDWQDTVSEVSPLDETRVHLSSQASLIPINVSVIQHWRLLTFLDLYSGAKTIFL